MDAPAIDAAALSEIVAAQVPILGAMGVEVVVAERGRAEATMPLAPNRNHVGTAYAGSLFSVAEVLGGVLALTSLPLEGFAPVVKSFQINYLRPVFSEVRAAATLSNSEIEEILTTAEAVGKADFMLRVTLVNEEGREVAAAEGAYQLRDFRPKA